MTTTLKGVQFASSLRRYKISYLLIAVFVLCAILPDFLSNGTLEGQWSNKPLAWSVFKGMIFLVLVFEYIIFVRQFKALSLQKEAKFQILFQNHPSPIVIYDDQRTRILDVNESAVRKYGYSKEEFVSQGVNNIVVPEGAGNVTGLTGIGKTIAKDSGTRKIRKKDGDMLLADISAYAISYCGQKAQLEIAEDIDLFKYLPAADSQKDVFAFQANKESSGLSHVSVGPTGKVQFGGESSHRVIKVNEQQLSRYVKQTEQIIEEQEFRMRTIFENLDMAVIIVDLGGKILFFNEDANSMNEFSVKTIEVGVSLFELVPGERISTVKDALDNVIKCRKATRYTAKYLSSNTKEPHWFSIHYSPVNNALGDVTRVCITARDITEQKLSGDKLTEEKNVLRTLIDHLPDYIYVKDKGLHNVISNKARVKLIGASSEEETFGNSATMNFSAELSGKFEQDDLDVITSGKDRINYEEQFTDEVGQQHCLLTTKIPLKNNHGETVGLVSISRDITELVAYRKQLEHKVRERTRELNEALAKERQLVEIKSRFVSVASHEFRIPLSTIHFVSGYLQKFLDRIDSSTIKDKLNTIQSQVNQMTYLLDDVLTVAKSEAGKLSANLRSIDINSFLDTIIEEVETSTRNTHKIIKTGVTGSVSILSDEKFLRNIFINLLTNAIKFSPQRQVAFLDISRDQTHLTIAIRDEGVGIKPSDLERIFQPFNRGENVQGIQGTGLGLSIVKKAVETLKGEIHVSSEIDRGTVFTVMLPL